MGADNPINTYTGVPPRTNINQGWNLLGNTGNWVQDVANALQGRLPQTPTTKPSTGVVTSPLSGVRLPERIGKPIQGNQKPAEPSVPPVIQKIREMYGNLGTQLGQLSADERQRIMQTTNDTIRSLQTLDPLASYRQTAPQLAAPTAAATSYLNAIGASPEQVTAQQALGNQLMASQAESQNAFSNAMDQYLRNYQGAQESQAYLNQAQALANLGYSTQAQQTGIGLAQIQAENQIRQMMLDYMAKISAAATARGGPIGPGMSPFGSNAVLF